MTKQITAALVLVVTFGPGILAGAIVNPAAYSEPTLRIKPCAYDDGTGPAPCLWDARTRGNSEGRSFISPYGTDESLLYID